MQSLPSAFVKAMALVLASAFHLSIAQAADREISVMAWGTAWEQALKPIADNFTKKTGIHVIAVTQAGSADGLARLQAMRGAPKIDVWFSTASLADRATTDKQLFLPISLADLSNSRDLVKGSVSSSWVAAYYYPLTILYRPTLVKNAPTAWKDLWKPEFSSALAVPDVQTYPARMLIIAATAHGGSIDNVDPGFTALKALKPNIAMFYGSDSDARRALAQGEVSVLVAPPNQLKPLLDAGVDIKAVAATPSPIMHDVMTLVNTPKKEMALQFINYMISEEAQTLIAERYNMAPVNGKVKPAPLLAPILAKEQDRVFYDEAKINANVAAWNARFKSEIAK
jgi:putative spermidine/putrescine transport system substrate-binding protein